jgi:hypothetical protein
MNEPIRLRNRNYYFSPLAGIHLIGTKLVAQGERKSYTLKDFSPLAGIHLIGTPVAKFAST